nr:CoB--CoM heterodisulfide reductase iron-sulfur subunit A family protein [Bacteroidota bacterium]
MEEPRIGVYVCWCGTNIEKVVDVAEVAKAMEKLPNVVLSKNYKYMCSDPGQDLIIKDIKENNLNRIVVSACSPRIHELTFRKTLEKAGLNPYLLQMANIREHVSWVHDDKKAATDKAKSLVAAAVTRVNHHEELQKRTVDINPATLIIGGGIAGLTAALEIADAGKKVFLLEKTNHLGGVVAGIDQSFPYFDSAQQIIQQFIKRIKQHENVEVLLNTKAENITGYVGNFKMPLPMLGIDAELEFGNIIVATGLKPYDPSAIREYGYGYLPNVITSLEFEKMLMSGKIETKDGKTPEDILIIHCVGSRNKNCHEYCSRTCCMTALKFATQLRSALPKANIYQAYADMRSFGKDCEELYLKASQKDIMFLMYDQQKYLPEIRRAPNREKCEMLVEIEEILSGDMVEVPADLVILMTAMEAHEDVKDVARTVGVSLCGNDFFIERHPKLDPVATTTDGVFIAGTCQAPKDIPDSVAQAKAAAARVLSSIDVGQVEIEVTTAFTNEDLCCGCQTCISVCPYKAIGFNEENRVSVVNEILCKGCGTCSSACPTGAIRTRHFTDKQIMSQIEGMLSMTKRKSKKTELEV